MTERTRQRASGGGGSSGLSGRGRGGGILDVTVRDRSNFLFAQFGVVAVLVGFDLIRSILFNQSFTQFHIHTQHRSDSINTKYAQPAVCTTNSKYESYPGMRVPIDLVR